jgi:hypothetical protein
MPSSTLSKADLQEQIDGAIATLQDVYTPETSREDLAAAVGAALAILNGEDEEDDDVSDDAGDDDGDSDSD